MSFSGHLLVFVLIFSFTTKGNCYLPVICMPGIVDFTLGMKRICTDIEALHLGTKGYFIQPGGFAASTVGMWKQIELYRPLIDKVFQMYPNGVNIIAHSQGTAIARGIMATTPNHPVKNFLAVAGPLMGIYGVPFANTDILGLANFNNMSREDLYKVFYTDSAQDTFSVAGYWNDPLHHDLFMANSKFLPYVANMKDHENKTEYKNNFLRLKKVILFGGGAEEIVIPKESSLMGYYDENLNIVAMKNQSVYKNDSFGLRTLDERGALIQVYVPEAKHLDWILNPLYTSKYYLQYLD